MLGEKIKQFRHAKGFTQEQLAEALFVSTGYISELETGKKMPSLPIIIKIIEILDCPPNELFEYKSKESKNEIDNTISAIINLLSELGPDEKFKVYSYTKDQYNLFKALKK